LESTSIGEGNEVCLIWVWIPLLCGRVLKPCGQWPKANNIHTRAAWAVTVNVRYSMEKLTRIYTQEIVRLHRVPSNIVLDRDPRFTSRF
jgi:hypothetical protein